MKWIRLWTEETIKGTTFQELDVTERGIWFSLLAMAGTSLSPGIVEIRKGVGYSIKFLAEFISCDEKILQKTLKKLQKFRKIELLKDKKRVKIVNWEKYQTRYAKYYKDKQDNELSNPDSERNGIKDGIYMPDRKEGEGEEEEEEGEGDKYILTPQKLFDLYNEICVNLPRAREFTKSRKEKSRVRFKEHGEKEFWVKVFTILNKTPFLRGENKTGWRADFDWIIANDQNCVKVLEGRYGSTPKKDQLKRVYVDGSVKL